ncbi:MAG TPA: hypothetical protein VHM65_09410 [Candidatus Lustribacter sp.]|nr:hypothetical protein [Candidatus Lustribacter sp.]
MSEILPESSQRWCTETLGSPAVELLSSRRLMSDSRGVRLADGREVMVKRRWDDHGRAAVCVQAQRALADAGMPVARPLTGVHLVDGDAVHAETWVPGGQMMRRDDTGAAAIMARLLARVQDALDALGVAPPLPNADWVRWYRDDDALWAPNAYFDEHCAEVELPGELTRIARRCRARLLDHDLPFTVGHADWEVQNLRFDGEQIHVIHDWDSLAWLPEAALAGTAAGGFVSQERPTLAPLRSSEVFLEEYQHARGRSFTGQELEIAWAASLWIAVHNARAELLVQREASAWPQVQLQAGERLSRAGA